MTPTEKAIASSSLAEARRQVRAGLARDIERARTGESRPYKVGRTGERIMSIDADVYTKAAMVEGPEISTPAADGWWQDQMDRYPHLRNSTWRGVGGSLDGLHTRLGRVTTTYRKGRWWLVAPDGTLTPDNRPGKLVL